MSDRYITQQHIQRNRCLQCERKQNILLLPVCMGGWVQEVQEQREKKEHKTANVFLECCVSLTTKHGCRRAESEKSKGFSPEGQSLSLRDSWRCRRCGSCFVFLQGWQQLRPVPSGSGNQVPFALEWPHLRRSSPARGNQYGRGGV